MKFKFSKKRILLFTFIITMVVILSSYVYISDNTGIINLPKNIIPIDQGITVAYLIKIPSGYLMFDTGYENDFYKMLQIINKKNIKIDQIKYLLLSHHHDDHVGYIAKLLEAQPSLKIIVHEKTITLLASGENNTKNGGGIVNPIIYTLFRIKQFITPEWTLTFPPFNVRSQDIVLQGDFIELPVEVGIKAFVAYTPGHTSDSISLIIDNKYLLCGDLSSNFLNWAGANHLTLFNEDIDSVYSSWQKVLSMKIKYVLPAHGKPFHSEKLKHNLYKYKQEDLVKFF